MRMKTRSKLGIAAALAVAAVSFGGDDASAAEPTVSFDTLGIPAGVAPGETHVLNLRYAVSGSDLENATISIDLPHGVLPTGAGHDTSWSGGCEPDPGTNLDGNALDWRCSWTAATIDVPQGGVSGQIALTLAFPRYAFGHGEALGATANLAASYDDAGTIRSINPIQSSFATTVTGGIDLQWGNSLDVSYWSYAYTRLPDGTVGLVATAQVGILNYGTSRVDAGATIDLTLPPGAVLAGWDPSVWGVELVSDTSPGEGGMLTFGLRNTLGTFTASAIQDSSNGETYAGNIYTNEGFYFPIKILFTCDALPVGTNETVGLTLSGVAPGVSTTTPSVLTSTTVDPSWTLTDPASQFICGRPIRVDMTRSSSSGASQVMSAQAPLHPPTGEVPVADAYNCMYIPVGLDAYYAYSYIPVLSASTDAANHGFETWICRVPDTTGTFDRATFVATHRDSGACEQITNGAQFRDPAKPRVTHVVLLGPDEWGVEDDLGVSVWAPVNNNVQVVSTECMEGATEANLTLLTYASASVDGAVQSATSTLDIHRSILATPQFSRPNNPTTATRGQTQTIAMSTHLSGDSAALRNPVVTIPLPPGVTPVDVWQEENWGQNDCIAAPLAWSVIDGELVITTGTDTEPWYLDSGCYQNGCRQGGYLHFYVKWAFSATHPFYNGEPVAFDYRLTGDNLDPNGWPPDGATHREVITMQVPGEKRLVLGPTCDASGRTGLVTRFANSGGIPLTGVVVDVPVPRVGDGSGTEVNASLDSAVSSIGDVTCSTDGASFSTVCDANTTIVRVTADYLAPYQQGELVITFASDDSFPVGAVIRHSATMSSAELLPIAAPPGPPARWNRCPGTVALSAWFDSDGDGTPDMDEIGLVGWEVTFTEENPPTGDALVFTIVVTPDGAAAFEVPPGDYAITVTPIAPVDEGAVWTFAEDVPAGLTVTTGATTTLSLAVSCVCEDDDACTTDTCTTGGVCGHVINPEVPGCVAECGNGTVERGEMCDAGAVEFWDEGCYNCKCDWGYESNPDTGLCRPICGDGNTVGDEECDDGGESDWCTADCRLKCGNGVIDAGEQCDTGTEVDLVGGCLDCQCSFAGWMYDAEAGTCVPRCGDHLVMGDETCDDGNSVDGDGCSRTCQIEDGWACERPPLTGCLPAEFCGDDRPSWCVIENPRDPGAAPTDWCGFIFGGDGVDQDFCALGDLRCEDAAEECAGWTPDNGEGDNDICQWRYIFCGFCDTMGTSECTELCFPTAEVCNGLDDDCDGLADGTVATGSGSVCGPVETAIVTHPPLVTADANADFTYENPADPSNTAFECRLDAGEWFRCDGGETAFSDLNEGQHVLAVRAIRGDGVVDATPAFYTWTIDSTVPDTIITTGPDDPTGSATATFTFDATVDNVDTYYCAMTVGTAAPMEGDWVECDATAVYTGLDDGQHTLWVYVVTTAGVADPTPAHWTFTVDTDAPETVITSGPDAHTTSTEAILTYEDPDDPTIDQFMCRLDGGAWYACDGGTAALDNLADGSHTFEVHAVDALGNVDASPASWTWIVDNTPPETVITSGPADPSQTGSGTFVFDANEDEVTYFCVIVAGDATPAPESYVPCDETHAFEGLDNGDYTLWVYAVDQAGNADTTPATWSWTVDDSAPETEITRGPDAPVTTGTDVVFTYTSPGNEGETDFECRVDGGEWYACNGGATTVDGEDLPDGEHTFEVRACDRTREICDPTPAQWTWTVTDAMCPGDEAGPEMTCDDGVTAECVGGTAEVDITSLRATAVDTCQPIAITAAVPDRFVLGENQVVFTSEDGVGNTSSCTVPVTVADTQKPNVTCPGDMVLPLANDFCGASWPAGLLPSASDACWGTELTFTSDAPEIFSVGTTDVRMTWTDGSGNVAECRFAVTVPAGSNLDAQCPRDAYVAQGSGCGGGDGNDIGLLLIALTSLGFVARRRIN